MRVLVEKIRPGAKVENYYSGSLDNRQGRTIINLYRLEMKMRHISEYVPKESEKIILIDSLSINDNRLPTELNLREPIIIIDHHKIDNNKKEKGDQFI